MIEMKQTEAFQKWLENLRDDRAAAMISARLLRLSHGLSGDVAAVGEGISELRIHYGPGYRVYFRQNGNVLIILLCGGNKNSQAKDIKRAKELASTWKS